MAFFVSEGIQSSETGCSEQMDVESGPQVHEQDCEPACCSSTIVSLVPAVPGACFTRC